ncbi:hypothetical protein RFI_16040 [Reticulomyxa filosa]|uniref:Uncharacterized protein n=1 Tax=Reticulomyxa filosa TaxID=46433 RepID=X6N777_RETFI|nr:hypothetical protein RFI_16040 [Reticulomyxa filosa]|eukprot:ETO21167.1 hypothetical protein RFI_16040 [Reticulomyxa filosa]
MLNQSHMLQLSNNGTVMMQNSGESKRSDFGMFMTQAQPLPMSLYGNVELGWEGSGSNYFPNGVMMAPNNEQALSYAHDSMMRRPATNVEALMFPITTISGRGAETEGIISEQREEQRTSATNEESTASTTSSMWRFTSDGIDMGGQWEVQLYLKNGYEMIEGTIIFLQAKNKNIKKKINLKLKNEKFDKQMNNNTRI